MTTMTTKSFVWELANLCIQEKGYFVIASYDQRSDIVDDADYFEGVKLVIVGEATKEEFDAQQERGRRLRPDLFWWTLPEFKIIYYYKVTAE
jgi:hypothetical protein